MKREQTFTTACLERLSALVIVIEDPAMGIPPQLLRALRGRARPDSYMEISWSSLVPRGYTCILRARFTRARILEPHGIGGL